jgi:hypothetical protein
VLDGTFDAGRSAKLMDVLLKLGICAPDRSHQYENRDDEPRRDAPADTAMPLAVQNRIDSPDKYIRYTATRAGVDTATGASRLGAAGPERWQKGPGFLIHAMVAFTRHGLSFLVRHCCGLRSDLVGHYA